MKILVTGAKGFVGKNLCAQLNNIKEGKARNYSVKIDEVFEYDIDSTPEDLDRFCKETDFVFNLAGVNRPENPEDFRKGNFGFASTLLDTLKKHGNRCPVMLSSSIQATLMVVTPDIHTVRARRRGRNSSSNIRTRPERRFLYTVSRTSLENGADQTTIPLSPLSATT